MDRNYRSAIALVEQADQLVNRATSKADLELRREKVNRAQKHLDALPVWFLGYEPQMYRTFFSFGWKFTFDEFEAARTKIGRMDAIIFQEINAIDKLTQAQQEIQQAKQNYQQAKDVAGKQKAMQCGLVGFLQRATASRSDRTAREIINIINKLEKVQPQTTVYRESQTLISFAQKKLQQLK